MVPFGELHGGRGQPERVMFDSLTACTFIRPALRELFGIANWGVEMLNAACGWDLTMENWDSLLRRIVVMERCYSMREGYVPMRDDMLPDRFFQEPIHNKYGEARILDRDEFLAQREKWYLSIDLTSKGIPTEDYIRELGLGFVIPMLDKWYGNGKGGRTDEDA